MTVAFALTREQFVALNGGPAEQHYHFCRNREHTPLRDLSCRLATRLPAPEDAPLELECLKHSSISKPSSRRCSVGCFLPMDPAPE